MTAVAVQQRNLRRSRRGYPTPPAYIPPIVAAMNRRTALTHLATATLATSPLTRLLSHHYRPQADGEFNVIRGNVGYYTNKGGTIGVYLPGGKPEGAIVVDSQFPDAANDLLNVLRENGGLNQLSLLVNTHHHGDHTGGNEVLLPLTDQSIIHQRAHDNLVNNLKENDKLSGTPLPKTTFTDSWSTNLHGGKESLSIRHFGPAHTGGDAVVHFEEANVAHLGDLLFNRRFPYVDVPAGADILNWPAVLKKVRQAYDRNTIYIFGHAAEGYPVFGTASDLKAFENYLRRLRQYVRKELRAKTTLEALKAKTTTIPGAAEWSFGERLRDVNLEVMYNALSPDN